jgi:hypothetical protein
MKTLTLRVPDAMAAAIALEASERKLSKSEVIRERLAQPASSPSTRFRTLAEIMPGLWTELHENPPAESKSTRPLSPHKKRVLTAIHGRRNRHR